MKINNINYINKRTVIVSLDNEYQFPLYKDVMNLYNLSVGMDINDDKLELIVNKHVKDMARGYILDSLGRSSKTKAQMIEKTLEKGYPRDVVDVIIGEFENLGYIDDYNYARNYYELKATSKSLYYIKNMLRSKGVPDNIISEVLSDGDESYEIKQIEKFLDTKLKGNKNITPNEKNKIIASLFRKGYKTSNIYLIISQYLA